MFIFIFLIFKWAGTCLDPWSRQSQIKPVSKSNWPKLSIN